MTYSFTEKKRIRKSFGSRDSVLEVPYLLQMQRDAYTAFLQADTPAQKRGIEGLQAAFKPKKKFVTIRLGVDFNEDILLIFPPF